MKKNTFKLAKIEKKKILKKLAEFHGHLGVNLVLGYRLGLIGLEKIEAEKYFGIEVLVYAPNGKPPDMCIIDGLQIATGATYGKGNIRFRKKSSRNSIEVIFINKQNKKKMKLSLLSEKYAQLRKEAELADKSKNVRKLEYLCSKILNMKEEDLVSISQL